MYEVLCIELNQQLLAGIVTEFSQPGNFTRRKKKSSRMFLSDAFVLGC